jgi:hypothetical protein
MTRYFQQTLLVNGGVGIRAIGDDSLTYTQYVQKWYHPLAADDDYYVTTVALPDGETLTCTLLKTAPDLPRTVTVVASAAATSKVTVTGTNQFGEAVAEEITLNGATPVISVAAFKTVTSVVAAARIDGAANLKVGMGSGLGAARQLVGFAAEGTVDGANESTAPAVSTAGDHLTFNTALNPAKTYIAKFWSSQYI